MLSHIITDGVLTYHPEGTKHRCGVEAWYAVSEHAGLLHDITLPLNQSSTIKELMGMLTLPDDMSEMGYLLAVGGRYLLFQHGYVVPPTVVRTLNAP